MSDGFAIRTRSSGLTVVWRVLAVVTLLGGGGAVYSASMGGAHANPSDTGAASSRSGVKTVAKPAMVSMSTFGTLAVKVASQQKQIDALSAENRYLRGELDALMGPGGVIEQVIGHVRRIDGQGQALRLELVDALIDEPTGPVGRYDTDASARAPSARHQLVTKSAGAAPGVTARMSDPVPTMRPVAEPSAEEAEGEGR